MCKCKSAQFTASLLTSGISGFTDQFYKDLIKRYPPHNVNPEKCSTDSMFGYYETNGLRPSVWFSPDEVWELRGAE